MKTTGMRMGGMVAGGAWLMALLVAGIVLPAFSPAEKKLSESDEFGSIFPSSNPLVIEDQLLTRRISKVARGLEDDFNNLKTRYHQIPPFSPPADPHLDQTRLDNFILVYTNYVRERKYFTRNVMGPHPGLFRVAAMVGMIGNFHEVVKLRSLVSAGITEEEFNWIRIRIMTAGLYCVEYKLNRENPGPEDRKRLLELRDNLQLAAGVADMGPDGAKFTFYPEKLHLDQTPRGNLQLFLDNYPKLDYQGVHFGWPTKVTFDREAILAAARNNPP